jgi:hypothetical protein
MKTPRFLLNLPFLAGFATGLAAEPISSPIYVSSVHEFKAGIQNYFAPPGVGPLVAEGHLAGVWLEGVQLLETHFSPELFAALNGSRPHYLHITSGDYRGLIVPITGADYETNFVYLAEDVSHEIAGNESFRIRQSLTLNDLFGENNEAGFRAGTSSGTSDRFIYFSSASKASQTFFNLVFQGEDFGWYGPGFAPSGEFGIHPYEGFRVDRRESTSDLSVHIQTIYNDEILLIPIFSGLNYISLGRSFQGLSLGDSGLENGLRGGTSSGTADNVILSNPTTGGLLTYFQVDGFGWFGPGFTASNHIELDTGTLFGIRLRHAEEFLWQVYPDFE